MALDYSVCLLPYPHYLDFIRVNRNFWPLCKCESEINFRLRLPKWFHSVACLLWNLKQIEYTVVTNIFIYIPFTEGKLITSTFLLDLLLGTDWNGNFYLFFVTVLRKVNFTIRHLVNVLTISPTLFCISFNFSVFSRKWFLRKYWKIGKT